MKETAKAGELASLAREVGSGEENGQKILFIWTRRWNLSVWDCAFEEAGSVKIGLGLIMRTKPAPLYALSSVSYALNWISKERKLALFQLFVPS